MVKISVCFVTEKSLVGLISLFRFHVIYGILKDLFLIKILGGSFAVLASQLFMI